MALSVGKPSRARSSTGPSKDLNPKKLPGDELGTDFGAFLNAPVPRDGLGHDDVLRFLDVATGLRQEIHDTASNRDTFRRGQGFEKLLHVVKSLVPQTLNSEFGEVVFDLIHSLLCVLGQALKGHRGNAKYFESRVDGWNVLQIALLEIHAKLLRSDSDDISRLRTFDAHYFCLLSLALDSREGLDQKYGPGHERRGSNGKTAGVSDLEKPSGDEVLQHPQAAAIVLQMIVAQAGHQERTLDEQANALSERTLTAISAIADLNLRNRVALWQTGILSVLLKAFIDENLALTSSLAFGNLLTVLSDLGVTSLDDVDLLFRDARHKSSSREVLLNILQRSKEPGFIQFDLSLSGQSSLELPSLPRAFPPSTGYTLSFWIRVDDFDANCHTTLFGAFDSSQHCFILAYLERDSHQLILQTSIRSSRPSVRFKSTRFSQGRWYHIALVHRKASPDPRLSPAVLFVDGEFAEQVKIAYPETPGEVKEKNLANSPPLAGQRRLQPVQAFFGTPHDLALGFGKNQTISRWSLASAHMCASPLSDELVAVIHRLGPRYHGNLQDCLGPLLTYRASAELNRYNELLHPEKSEKSDIVIATENRGSDVLPEAKLLLGFNPSAVINLDTMRNAQTGVEHELDRKAFAKIQQLAQKTNAIAINTAVPALNEAIGRSYGTALLIGEPIVVLPKGFDDSSWQLSGCLPLLMRLLESANTKAALLQSVEVFLDCVKDNWRISEAMEKGNGFGVLAMILREKLGFEAGWSSQGQSRRPSQPLPVADRQSLPLELLHLVLDFVGYNRNTPEDSMIVNPMAYRVLLIDFDTWRRCDLETQRLYYDQFVHFTTRNKHQAFNAKRLARMRVTKKLVDAMKAEEVEPDAVQPLMNALKATLGDSATYHLYRDLAMFVAYGLQDGRISSMKGMKSLSSIVNIRSRALSWAKGVKSPGSRPSTPGGLSSPEGKSGVPRSELAVEVLELLVDNICTERSAGPIRRFNRAVTPRYTLHLLSETDVRVVVLTLRLICQALRCLGSEFRKPFIDNNGGFVIVRLRVKAYWRHASIWKACFAILFGRGISEPVMENEFSVFSLVDAFGVDDKLVVANPEILTAIMGMLEAGLRDAVRDEEPPEADSKLLRTVIQFLSELYSRSHTFREYATTSRYMQELLFVLYPVVVGSDRLSAETELKSDKDTLSFKGAEVQLRPHSNSLGDRPPSIRSTHSDTDKHTPQKSPRRLPAPKRLSSFEFLGSSNEQDKSSPVQFNTPITPKKAAPIKLNVGNNLIEALLEVALNLFLDQICNNSKYSGIGLFLKVPPGFQEHQAYFESYTLVQTLNALWRHLQLHQALFSETKVLMNLAKFCQHIAEAVFEGWFVDGAQALLDFSGKLLDYLQQPDVASIKSVRLCSQAINEIRIVFLRVILLRLSELDETASDTQTVSFLVRMNYWQTILFSSDNQETQFIRLICYILYTKLTSDRQNVRVAAAGLWRTMLVQKPTETATLLTFAMGSEQKHLSTGFMKLVSMDDEEFLTWIDDNRGSLDTIFLDALSGPWTAHVEGENRKNEETAKHRLMKRREKLRHWQSEDLSGDDFANRYETSTKHWRSNVHSQERLKLQRSLQDQQENVNHLLTVFAKIENSLSQPCGLEPTPGSIKWQLDETEGVNRMRMRILPDKTVQTEAYQPKRKMSERKPRSGLAVNTQIPQIISDDMSAMGSPTPTKHGFPDSLDGSRARADSASNSQLLEGGFEMVDDPREDDDGLPEDKNRKIMTSLQRGDQVQQLYNISRIVGLEACEGLLVVGKKCLYLQDSYFQRSDGEIVGATQAPEDERDPYVQLISGKDVGSTRTKHSLGDQTTRHWTWAEVLSISKRRFLFRDVSIELFFTDGRSYLLTLMAPKIRDDVYSAIVNRAPHVHSTSSVASEDAWRLDNLRNPEEVPQSFGSKFANVFNAAPTHAATKKWVRGEMSNFQYLMLVNTMAGRTFNDLTQYPVFPWVISDYTSEELDLSNPKAFRDLSKPMGCQNPGREFEYRERYKQFQEMGDQNAPPFHYGTHYSSAMIVTSYLIRMQPFVQAYLLLQGGNFDHADRLFDSIEKAWTSCSKDNMTDVRELTPEFYYLPEFLVNSNKYDFGEKQAGGGTVDNVQLPPWAKGDPHIFITKQREALESPFVSESLHKWIDLVFGYKQRGEAAIEATNVFQHLSYQGAKDLDTIKDPVERLATIGIIHSFGQTPHQVFQRPHPAREVEKFAVARLDTTAQSLTRLPDPLFESDEKVAAITFSRTQERLLCSGPGKMNMMPNCDRFLQWGFADHSLRFFSSNTKRMLGLYENTHVGPISTAVLADSKTLITAGTDCTIAIWSISVTRDNIDIQPKSYMFGHRTPVTHLAASRVFSTFLSSSADGQVLLWDLNRQNCIRMLLPAATGGPAVQAAAINNTTGHILLCRGPDVLVYTLNGQLLVKHQACEGQDDDEMTCCAFYEGAGNEWLERELVFTGHAHGIVNVWALTTLDDGAWHLQLLKRLNHADAGREDGGNIAARITAVLPMPQAVYTGDEDGRVWEWDPVQRSLSFAGGRGR